MAEKKKNASEEKTQETDIQFLERTNVTNIMQKVISKIISNRPEDPMSFLAEYFLSYEEQSGLVQKAFQTIHMTDHSRPMFDSNVRQAYKILCKNKVSKRVRGVNGGIYTDLLQALCREIQPTITSKLMSKIECCDFEAVPYDVFKSGVFTCCVLQDFSKLAEKLFSSLDELKTGKVDKNLCDIILQHLNSVLSTSKSDPRLRIIYAGYNLSPEVLYQHLEWGNQKGKNQTLQSSEQFVAEACETFLSKVTRLR